MCVCPKHSFLNIGISYLAHPNLDAWVPGNLGWRRGKSSHIGYLVHLGSYTWVAEPEYLGRWAGYGSDILARKIAGALGPGYLGPRNLDDGLATGRKSWHMCYLELLGLPWLSGYLGWRPGRGILGRS